MPVFRKRRARAGGSPAEAPKPVRPRPPALTERLARIAAETAPEEALEPALQAVLEESGVHAGALCLFDPRQGVLRLAAESGLSDEGCRRLRTVRRGDPASWDMPLHGLMNGRAYLIESAARNRYVPRLIEAAASVRTVACVPLNAGPAPVGSLILVAVAPRSLGERDIRGLEPVLGDLARMIEATRRRPRATETPAGSPAASAATAGFAAVRDRLLAEHERLAAELAARTAEVERLGSALDTAAADRSRLTAELEGARRVADQVTPLTAALAEAERARQRLAEALGAAATERSEQTRAVAALEAARTEAQQLGEGARAELASARQAAAEAAVAAAANLAEQRRQVERLEARLADAEAAAARRVEAARERERAHERAAEELRATLAQERRLREEREAAERGASDGRAELARAHGAARTDAEAARAELAQTTHVIEALEDEAARAQSEILRLEAELTGASGDRTRLEDALAEARARADEARERGERLDRELARLRRELDQTTAAGRERVAEGAGLAAQLEGLAAERDRLRETIAGLGAERDRLAAEAAARAGLDQALARERAERARLAAALAEAEAARGALEAAHARQAAEAAARVATLERELERAATERPPVETRVDEARGEAHGAPMQVVTVGAAPGGRPRPGSGELRVVVIDGDAAWESAGTGSDIVVLTPGEDLAARVTEIAPARVVVNLATRGALGALQSLRASGCTASFWGCVAAPAADRGIALGTIEASRCPLDPEAIVATLGSHVARGTRVLTAGTDVDALMSLRQALARLGASVSMAWDGKQAGDLLAVVQPEVVVVDLGLTRREGYLIAARLGGLETAPHAVLVEGADDAAEAFAATLADPGVAGRTKPLDRLLAELLTRREPEPAQQRRPKIRAVGLTRK